MKLAVLFSAFLGIAVTIPMPPEEFSTKKPWPGIGVPPKVPEGR